MMDGAGRMKQIGEAAAKAARHRKFHWCRRHNGFSDMPLWRVVAAQLGMPLYQVLAFVNRLEELANAADQRGHIGEFNAGEFGAALGMPPDDAARIYAALEHPDIGWIAYDSVVTFYSRNPDKDDNTAADRMRKMRARKSAMSEIARRAHAGEISAVERGMMERFVLARDWDGIKISTGLPLGSSYDVTLRNNVTVTPEQSTVVEEASVDNTGDGDRGESAGFPKGASGSTQAESAAATVWIDTEGRKKLAEYLNIRATLAETYIERWRRDLLDDVALMTIMQDADRTGYIGPRFHVIIVDQIKRFLARREHGEPLKLMPPRPEGALLRKTGGSRG